MKISQKGYEKVGPDTEETARKVVDAAYKLHSNLGPGLLESVYEAFFCHELKLRGLEFKRQVALSLSYEGLTLDGALRIDILVENSLIVELKAVESLSNLHRAQLRTYLKLSGKKLGLLINFNVPLIKDGIDRVVLTNKTGF